jgi:hypothetical protein
MGQIAVTDQDLNATNVQQNRNDFVERQASVDRAASKPLTPLPERWRLVSAGAYHWRANSEKGPHDHLSITSRASVRGAWAGTVES